jgi:hypothetical protein
MPFPVIIFASAVLAQRVGADESSPRIKVTHNFDELGVTLTLPFTVESSPPYFIVFQGFFSTKEAKLLVQF